jgi:RNA recognition motif-containing protein
LSLLAIQKAEFPGKEYPTMKIYVSNLPAGSSTASLANLFQPFGAITSVHVMTCGNSGRCRGFGYVDMVRDDGERAISKLNGEIADGILLRVKEARKRS